MCLFFNTRYNLHSVTSNAVANMIKKYSRTQIITAKTLQNGESVQIDVPITANKFYVGEVYFTGLPTTEDLFLMFNDYSGYFASSINSYYSLYKILNVIGKAYQDTLHIFLTNYTGHTVNLGDITFLFNYLELDIQDQTRDTVSLLMDKQAKK